MWQWAVSKWPTKNTEENWRQPRRESRLEEGWGGCPPGVNISLWEVPVGPTRLNPQQSTTVNMRRPLVIYDFATAPLWISLYIRKIRFSFLSVCRYWIGTYYCIFWNLESGIWIILLPAEFRMQIHTEFREIPRNSGKFYCKKYREIPRNSAEFRVFFKKFRIPSEVKNALPWTPYSELWSLLKYSRVKLKNQKHIAVYVLFMGFSIIPLSFRSNLAGRYL